MKIRAGAGTLCAAMLYPFLMGTPAFAQASFSNQVVTTQAPPSTGCVRPTGATAFLTTNNTVYLYFEATITKADSLSGNWLAPDGTVVGGYNWSSNSGTFCFPGNSLSIGSLSTTQLGSWQARVFDNGNLLFSVAFTVSGFGNQVVTTQAPASTGCVRPTAATSFLTTNNTVYLYFEGTTATSDSLSSDWLAPDSTVVPGIDWASNAGFFCFPGASLSVGSLPASQLGSWQARVYDNGSSLFSVPFTVAAPGNVTPAITSVTTAYAGPVIAQNTFIVVKGANLVPANTPAIGTIWSTAPSFAYGQMPTELGGVGVTVNNNPAFVYFYCSAATDSACAQDQLNILTPLDNTTGPVPVVVTSGGVSSPPFTVSMQAAAPSFLVFSSAGYVAATHINNTLVGPTSLYPGSTTPARPGETIVLYAVGFGLPAAALVNGSAVQSGSLPVLPVCKVGGTAAAVIFAGLASPGLYQLNLTIPATAPNGDNAISCTYDGSTTPAGDLITVQSSASSPTLTMTTSGTGTGTVNSSPAGTSCGAGCLSFAAGTAVTLTAAPNAGSTFAGWSGACSGTGGCILTLNSNQAVTATFNLTATVNPTLTIAMAGAGKGTVSSSPAGTSCGAGCLSFAAGTAVTLTAAPNAGSTFAGWSGACSGTGSCILTMNSNQAVTAAFNLAVSPTLVSIAVAPANSSIQTGTTLQLAATGTYTNGSIQSLTSSVNWSSSNTTFAAVNASGLVTGVSAGNVTITASTGSVAGTAIVAVTGTTTTGGNSVSQFISAAQGGTIALANGSSVTIPPGALASDQMVTLQSVSALPNQAPSGLLQNVGPGLILSLAIPNPPASFQTAAAGRVVAHDTATPAPIQFTFDPTLSTGAEFPDAGGIAYISSPGSMAPTAMGAGLLGGSGAAIVAAPPTYLDEASSIAVGLASLLPSAQAPIVVGPMHLTPPVPTLGQAAQWNTVPTFTCPTGHVLVLVHGVLSEVQGAFSNSTAENTREAGGYDDTEGFNYDFMGSVADNGNTLSEYLSQLAACPAVTSIGVEGHSYGGLVAGQAICDAPDPGGKINHLVTLATMWNGTPAATAVGAALSGLAAYQNAPMLFIANYPAIPGLALGIPAAASLQNASVITDMQPGSDAINRVQKCIQAKEQAGTLKAYAACGTAAQYSSIVEAGLDMGVSPDDGLVPVSSCNALPGSTPLGEFAVSHTKIEVSTAVQAAVGSAVRQFNSQYNLTVTTSQGTGSGTVSPPSPPGTPCGTNCWSYAYGAAVTLTANPAGNSVTKWSADGCSGNTCVVTMNSSLSVAVMFNLPYTYTGNYQTTTRISAIIGSGCTPSPLVTIGVGSQAATLLSTPLESPGTFSGTLTLAEGTITTTTPPMTCTTDGITTDVPGSTTPADVPGGTEAFSGTSDGHVISVSQATQAAICPGAATCSVSGTVSVLGENVYVTLNVVVSYPATGGVTTTGTMTLDLTEK